MSKPDAVAAVLWLGVVLYAVFGGADFGAGLWDLIAGDAEKGKRPRAQIEHSLGPVWEANHVWLIFILVVLWTAFSGAFAAIMTTLYIPLALAAVGIVLRGSGFAFRKVVTGMGAKRAMGAAFALSSVLTPFFMGTVAGAIASGHVPADGYGDPISSWCNLPSLLIGVMFVATGAYLAAVFLVADSGRAGDPELERYFAKRALAAAIVAGVVAIAGLFAMKADDTTIYDGLTGDALPLVILSAICGLAVLVMLARGIYRGVRSLAVGAVVAVIVGWGVAQHPYLLPTSLTIAEGAGDPTSLTWVLGVFVAAVLIVIPSLGLLYWLSQQSLLEE